MKRNLDFFLYPRRDSLWAWHIEQLLQYRDAFNARRLVMVAIDEGCESQDTVQAALAPLGPEVILVKNNPELYEAGHFITGLGLLESKNEDEMTFYAHSKGATHRGEMLRNAQRWSAAMYFMNLSSVELIERIMATYSAIGCFRHVMTHGGSNWHYSGTFFWIKHSTLFARNWKDTYTDRYAVEGYPGRHLRLEESFALTPDRHFTELYGRGADLAECRGWLEDIQTRSGQQAI